MVPPYKQKNQGSLIIRRLFFLVSSLLRLLCSLEKETRSKSGTRVHLPNRKGSGEPSLKEVLPAELVDRKDGDRI